MGKVKIKFSEPKPLGIKMHTKDKLCVGFEHIQRVGGGGGGTQYEIKGTVDLDTHEVVITSKNYFNDIKTYYDEYGVYPNIRATLTAETETANVIFNFVMNAQDVSFKKGNNAIALTGEVSSPFNIFVDRLIGYSFMLELTTDRQVPSFYYVETITTNTKRLVDAEVRGNVLVVSKQDGSIIEFTGGGSGGECLPFIDISKHSDYLYETNYAVIDYGYAKHAKGLQFAGCSILKKGNFVGRNFDFPYNEYVEFIVRTKANKGLYATLGVASANKELTKEVVERGEYTDPIYKTIPFCVVDGINEKGLHCAVNLIAINGTPSQPTIPLIEKRVSIPSTAVVRYVIDHFSNVNEAIDYIRNYVEIVPNKNLQALGYDAQFFITNGKDSVSFEIINQQIEITETKCLTNFGLHGVVLNSDGTVYTPATQDETHNAMITNFISQYGIGLERWNLIKTHYDLLQDKQDVVDFMKHELDYRREYNTFEEPSNPFWFTEYVGGDLTVINDPSDFEFIVSQAGGLFTDRTRDGTTWHTVHTSVYDLVEKNLVLFDSTEDGIRHEFSLEKYWTKEESDSRYAFKGEGGETNLAIMGGLNPDTFAIDIYTRNFYQDLIDFKAENGHFPLLTLRLTIMQTAKTKKGQAFIDRIKKLAKKVSNDNYYIEFRDTGTIEPHEDLIYITFGLSVDIEDDVNYVSMVNAVITMTESNQVGIAFFNDMLKKTTPRVVGFRESADHKTAQFENEKGDTVDVVRTPYLNDYQTKNDSGLSTSDKTVVGAINEHENDINLLKNNKQDKVDTSLRTRTKVVSGAINELYDELFNVETEMNKLNGN